MLDSRLYLAQRVSALIMAPLVLGHLVVMIYAVRGGLSAGEILERTRGSLLWLGFYGVFAVAVAVHAAIGLRVIVHEATGLKNRGLRVFTVAVFAILLLLGLRAVVAVTVG